MDRTMDPNALPDPARAPLDRAADRPREPDPVGRPGVDPGARRRLPAGRLVRRVAAGALVATIALGLFGAGAAVDRTGILGGPAAAGQPADATEFALIREAWDRLHDRYVGAADLDPQELAWSAIEGLAGVVDDPGHTGFLTPEEREAHHDALSGSFVGVGIRIEAGSDGVTVVGVIRDSPADSAGIRAADRIVAVDGTPVTGSAVDRVVELVKGEAGTTVTLGLVRPSSTEPVVVTVERAEIDVPAVSWARVPGTSVALLRLEQFSSGSAEQLKAALAAIVATGPDGVVLDLRGNPGGYVGEAVAVASQFLADGVVYESRDAGGSVTPTEVTPRGLATDVPLVVLVDGSSASSSEIVTGALQDAGRAEIVGRRTFGTGTVVNEVALADGSALRIGVIEWLTPAGRSIWRTGLAPDISVTLPAGAAPLAPEDLATMGPHALARSDDLQLLKALELLGAVLPEPTT
jgi:carboxyl-terminal processing protease